MLSRTKIVLRLKFLRSFWTLYDLSACSGRHRYNWKENYNKTNVLVVLERKSSTRLITSTLTIFIIPDRRVEAGSGEGQVFPSETCSAGVCVQRAIYISIQGNREWNFEILNRRYSLCSGETLIMLSERTDLKICLFQSRGFSLLTTVTKIVKSIAKMGYIINSCFKSCHKVKKIRLSLPDKLPTKQFAFCTLSWFHAKGSFKVELRAHDQFSRASYFKKNT